MTMFARSTLAGLVVAAALAAVPAYAETTSFKADLKGASTVPPVTSQGTGNVTATYDTTSKKLTWKGTVSGLSGNATAAHFHGPAEPGKNAGVLVPAPGVMLARLRAGAPGRRTVRQHRHGGSGRQRQPDVDRLSNQSMARSGLTAPS